MTSATSARGRSPRRSAGRPTGARSTRIPTRRRGLGSGSVLVADAGGNDLLRVSKAGPSARSRCFPAQPMKVTKALPYRLGLPKCTVGHKYYFEAVPTDVEVRGHKAYVTTLPGGPEDPSLGARGKVYRVNLLNGNMKLLAKHFLGATGVAVSTDRQGLCRRAVRQPHLDHLPPQAPDGALGAVDRPPSSGTAVSSSRRATRRHRPDRSSPSPPDPSAPDPQLTTFGR